MTDHQPEGTRLAAQLGDAVGGPEVPVPDPETETVDLRRKLWNVQRLGESMAGDRDETVRRCGEQVLAVLGDAALLVAAALERPTIDGEAPASDDTGRASASAHGKPRERAGAVAGEGSDGSEGGAGYSIVRTDELERLQEIEAEQSGRFRVKEIIKPDRDKDLYVGWSHTCEMPAWAGTRQQAIADGCPPSRLRRADERGTSMKDDFGCDWDDRGLIAEQRGFLPRSRIAEYVTLWLLGRKDEAFDLLEPFEGETEVRRG